MRRPLARARGFIFILWHSRHEFYHILLGLIWAWFLRETWGEFNIGWIFLSIFGSLLPDIDHLLYFLGYGRDDEYARRVKEFIKDRQWRAVTMFIETGHKENTNLFSHNIYVMLFFISFSLLAFLVDWKSGIILFGAIVIHYLFDIIDDLLILGSLNSNWKRWGKNRLSNKKNK